MRTSLFSIAASLCLGSLPASVVLAQTAEPTAAPAVAEVAAPAPAPAPAPAAAAASVTTKWSASLYGFAEFDALIDSTQSFKDSAVGNSALSRNNTYGGNHGRTQFTVRNSRFGFKLGAPTVSSVKPSAVLEFDFFGNQPSDVSEASFFSNPAVRVRHAYLKLENPIVDVWAGQTWNLFGMQPLNQPNTVAFQGLPTEIYSRTPQVRLIRGVEAGPIAIEVAAALARPPQRDGNMPDLQGAVKVKVPGWVGVHTGSSTGTAADPLTIGVSGVMRTFAGVASLANSKDLQGTTGWGVSVDGYLPILPAKLDDRSNALTINGSYVKGEGIADLYTGLSGAPNAKTTTTIDGTKNTFAQSTATQNIDSGLVGYDATGKLKAVQWDSMMAGVQYYLPGGGNVWVAGNFGYMKSNNAKELNVGKYKDATWFDANLFYDVTPAVRLGASYAQYKQTLMDGSEANDNRAHIAAIYLF